MLKAVKVKTGLSNDWWEVVCDDRTMKGKVLVYSEEHNEYMTINKNQILQEYEQ